MSDPDRTDTAEWWLQFAYDDLLSAEHLLTNPRISPWVSCHHSQQAAEKAIKAALVRLQVEFPFTHRLETLLGLLPGDWEIQDHLREVATLSQWAVDVRYPGVQSPPTQEDARKALEQARLVIGSIERAIT